MFVSTSSSRARFVLVSLRLFYKNYYVLVVQYQRACTLGSFYVYVFSHRDRPREFYLDHNLLPLRGRHLPLSVFLTVSR